MITPTTPTLSAMIASLEARVRSLELGPTGIRPRLFVLAPVTSRTVASRVPYATVNTDTAGTWSGSPNYQWVVPVSGLWLISVQSKVDGSGGTSQLTFKRSSGNGLSSPNSNAPYAGVSLSGVRDISAGTICWIEEGGTYTPLNDAVASNYFQMTYLGKT